METEKGGMYALNLQSMFVEYRAYIEMIVLRQQRLLY